MSQKLREVIAEYNERVEAEWRKIFQADREDELIAKKFPDYWHGLESAIRESCENDSEGILRITRAASDSQIRIISELGWLELIVSQELGTREIVAHCRTNHFRSPETSVWVRRFKAVYCDGNVCMAPTKQEDTGSAVLHSAIDLSEELLCALIRSG